jgi:hypothetical protein
MAFGITAEGFKAKRLSDIQTETEAAWRGKFGAAFDLDSRTPEGQIRDIEDEREESVWELAEAVSRAYNPKFAEGAQLDNILALSGISRKLATFSKIDSGRARGAFGTIVLKDTIIAVDNDPTAQFKLDADTPINIAAVNERQKLAFSVTPTSGDFKVVFDGEITLSIPWNSTASAVQAFMESLVNIGAGNVAVSGSITSGTGLTFDFQGALAGLPLPQMSVTENNLVAPTVITPSTLVEGEMAKSQLCGLTATATGPVAAPTGSLTEIITPVTGLISFTNEEDAVLGRNIEEDPDAKLRREDELSKAGAATRNAIRADVLDVNDVTAVVVFSNRKSIVDIDGRPPKSVDIVVQGGDEDEIAEAIYNTVADGIETIGAISKNVIDSQGFTEVVKFSRPVEVPIWIQVDVTKEPSVFPADGAALIKSKILAWGLLRQIGQDVIVFGTDALSCSFDDVPGMSDLVFRVGIAVNPTLDNNVVIAPREIAMFDTARIQVNVS